MAERIERVIVLGGGDSGLLTALSLRQLNPGLDVTVIDDFSRNIPQVGKSTYHKITDLLHGFLDIDELDFVSAVRPVWKASVYFRDWCGYQPFHFAFDADMRFPSKLSADAGERFYHQYRAMGDRGPNGEHNLTLGEELVRQRKSPWVSDPMGGGLERYPAVAYHLNTRRFNDYLRSTCRDRDIGLVDDAIVNVETDDGCVAGLRSKRQEYDADLYVDATGFSRVLRDALDSSFLDFGFPLDAAYNTRVDLDVTDIEPATVIETGDHGWFWQIDTTDNRDRGYVYASEFVSDEDALAEFIEHIDAPVDADDVDHYEFSSGYYERAWAGNCVSIGNAQGFVEPLQSTALTANLHAAQVLASLLSTHDRVNHDGIRYPYNAWVSRLWESIRDFVDVHYRYADGDTAFWEAARSMDVSPRVTVLEDEFDRRGFEADLEPVLAERDIDELRVFYPEDFLLMMRYMGATSAFYETTDFTVSDTARRELDEKFQQARENVESYLTVREFYAAVVDT